MPRTFACVDIHSNTPAQISPSNCLPSSKCSPVAVPVDLFLQHLTQTLPPGTLWLASPGDLRCSSSSPSIFLPELGFRQEPVTTKPGEGAWVCPLHAKALPEAVLAVVFLHCLHPKRAASGGEELWLPGMVGQHVTHVKYRLREGKTAALG